jgi:HPt (histidine-containing phosphotransfer) domain-containing protein
MEGDSLLNIQALMDCFGNDAAFVNELLDDFYQSTKAHLPALRAAVETKDAKAVAMTAHSLKGISASMFLMPLKDAFYQLEMMGKQGNLENAHESMDKADALFSQFEKEYQDRLAATSA